MFAKPYYYLYNNFNNTAYLELMHSRRINFSKTWHSTKHGLDWTGQLDWTVGLDSWTGQLDWTIGLDYWTGFRMGFFPLNRRNLTDSKVYGMFLRKTK